MAQTQQEIYDAMDADASGRTALAAPYNTSITSRYRQYLMVFAYAAVTLQQMWDDFTALINGKVASIAPMTIPWYLAQVFKFQYNYELVFDSNNVPSYPTIDTTAQIIAQAAVTENLQNGTITIKAAKLSGSMLVALASGELTAFTNYIWQISAGDRISIVSLNADLLLPAGTIYYDGTLDPTALQTAIQSALDAYIKGLTFNNRFSVLDAQIAIKAVPGVKDMLVSFSSKPYGGSYVPINTSEYEAASGYFNLDTFTFTMTPYA